MKRIREIAKKFFLNPFENEKGEGLFATLEDLISQKKYTKYFNVYRLNKAYSPMSGDVKSVFKGRGVEFEEIRAYEYGDEVRDIDWRVTARKSVPYTKIYNEERNRDIYVFLDLSSSMVFGTQKELKSVLASKIAALLAWLALENKDRLGCLIFDGQKTFLFKPKNYRENVLAILKKISEISKEIVERKGFLSPEISFAKVIQQLQMAIKTRSSVFLISDFVEFQEEAKKNVVILAAKNTVYLIKVFDRLEKDAPSQGEYMISSGENLVFETTKETFKEAYSSIFVHNSEDVKRFCHKFSCGFIEVNTGVSAFNRIKL